MDWQTCVNDQMVGSGKLSNAAALDPNGNALAATAGFAVSSAEGQALIKQFANPNTVFTSGVTINGTHYTGVRGDGQHIYGRSGTSGVIVVKTYTAVLVGRYTAPITSGDAAGTVEDLADNLMANGA